MTPLKIPMTTTPESGGHDPQPPRIDAPAIECMYVIFMHLQIP